MLYMLHKDLVRFLECLSQVCQNQASERKALLAEWDLVYAQGGAGGGVFLGILDGSWLPGSSNPDPISDQKVQFSTPVFRLDL